MAIRLEAYVLLKSPLKLSTQDLVEELGWRYPQIGKARVKRGTGGDNAGAIVIEGATVGVSAVNAPYPREQLQPPMKIVGYDTERAEGLTAGHSAYVVVTTTSESDDLEWVRAHAALVTLVVSALLGRSKSVAVFWSDSWMIFSPEEFERAASEVLRGHTPVGIWCSFAPSNPSRLGGEDMTGMVSLGLRKYLGRELELAPVPAMPGEAVRCMREAARRLLEGEWHPSDGETIALDSFPQALVTRAAEDGFLRMGVPALVLVSPDAAVDADTLERKGGMGRAATGGGGLMSKIFGRR